MEYEIEELIPIVAELSREYSGCDSTSITYEKAQMLMGGVIYCLNENRHLTKNDLADNRISAREQYLIGSRIVLEKVEEVRKTYNKMSVYFDSYNVECLRDTVIKGILEFMKWYDAKYCPQDTILTLDYPLLIDIRALSGIDAIYAYIKAIEIEQIFLKKFDRSYVLSVLERANRGFEYMLDNICEIVLLNNLGHAALGKPLSDKGFTDEEYEKLALIYTSSSIDVLKNNISFIIEKMIRQIYQDGQETLEYLCNDLDNITIRIDTAVQTKQLNKLFVI